MQFFLCKNADTGHKNPLPDVLMTNLALSALTPELYFLCIIFQTPGYIQLLCIYPINLRMDSISPTITTSMA